MSDLSYLKRAAQEIASMCDDLEELEMSLAQAERKRRAERFTEEYLEQLKAEAVAKSIVYACGYAIWRSPSDGFFITHISVVPGCGLASKVWEVRNDSHNA